jgi:hypothetical protein
LLFLPARTEAISTNPALVPAFLHMPSAAAVNASRLLGVNSLPPRADLEKLTHVVSKPGFVD